MHSDRKKMAAPFPASTAGWYAAGILCQILERPPLATLVALLLASHGIAALAGLAGVLFSRRRNPGLAHAAGWAGSILFLLALCALQISEQLPHFHTAAAAGAACFFMGTLAAVNGLYPPLQQAGAPDHPDRDSESTMNLPPQQQPVACLHRRSGRSCRCWIPTADLAEGRFDRVWLVMQCS